MAPSQFHAAASQALRCSPRESASVLWMIERMAQPVEKLLAEPGWSFPQAGSPVVEKFGLNCLLPVSWILRKLCSCCNPRAPDWQPQSALLENESVS